MILQPLPVPRAEQVKTLGTTVLQFPVLAYPEMREVRDNNTVFAGVAGEQGQVFGMEAEGVTRPVMGFEVSGQYFDVFAIQPMLGRLLRPSDDAHPGASDALVLSYSAWKSHFASDPNIVGKIVKINKHPYTIVGVTQEGFLGSLKFLQPEFYLPMSNEASLEGVDWLNQWHEKNIGVVVRIKDGVSLPEAQAQLATIAGRIQRINPAEEEGLGFTLARPGLVGDYVGKPAMRFLAGVMGLAFIVLLAACANLGSLFAARTADRAREISIRMAVAAGAGRGICDFNFRRHLRVRHLVGGAEWAGGVASADGLSDPVFRGAATFVDRDGVFDFGAGSGAVRVDAAAADFQGRPE